VLPFLPLLAVVPAAACGDDDGRAATAPDAETVLVGPSEVRVRLDRAAELAAVGGSLLVTTARVLVTRPAADEYLAFDAACPHAGSLVANRDGAALACPGHGSRFDLRGALLRGPAQQGLTPLALRREDARTLVVARP
jgi:Rieske Fe-S protein